MMPKEQVMQLVHAALEAVDPTRAVQSTVRRQGDRLYVGGQIGEGLRGASRRHRVSLLDRMPKEYDLNKYRHIYVVGGGKAGVPMVWALSQVLGERLTAGWVNVKDGHLVGASLPKVIRVQEASHPIPNEVGRQGAQQILDLVGRAGAGDLIFCLISGGGSALLPLPVQGITLEDLQALTDALLLCGATINEINAVRKHCSQIKGGQLARAAYPSTVISLVLSDVVGNPLDVIASGPTVPDTTTFDDAYQILLKYGILDGVPERVVSHLRAGVDGQVPETPKEGDPIFENVHNVIIGSNAIAAQAARDQAVAMGFSTLLLSTYVEGEAREVGRVMAGIAKSLAVEGWPLPVPACVIAGGETTVTVRGSGKGGRNQELALAAALALDGWQSVTLFTLATDGIDGPTDAAGAVVDGQTARRGAEMGMAAADFLAENDSYTYFDRLGDLIRTGATNTNVNDLLFILAQ
jgi:glycerate 2-kinase